MKIVRLCILLLIGGLTAACNQSTPSPAVASAHPAATEAGLAVLEEGGNAFDAAVAVSATLAVVEPYSSGLGGGGFWLLHEVDTDRNVMIDGREKAPQQARRDMYLDEQGEVIDGLSMDGPLAAGIPGEPATLVHLAREYGRLSLSRTLAPAIRAAREGFAVTPHYQRMARFRLEVLRRSQAAAEVFLLDGEVPPLDHVIRQPDLAATLEQLARQGSEGFYKGKLAERLVEETRAAGGIWTREDLRRYQVVEREPITGSYGDYRIISASPPSSGGVALVSMLNMLEDYDLAAHSAVDRVHLMIEAMRRAYRDRAEYLGDPDFVEMDIERLTSKAYAARLRQSIELEQATDSRMLPPATESTEGNDTTHFSILDSEGNRVAATLSVNYPFGSGFMVPGTGVLLNNEMDDFSAKPGEPNAYGLVGAEANAIEPGKRMLSSMSPTFVEHDDRLAILGTPGGSRIITMVLHGILGFVEGHSAQTIVGSPRYHHQYLPDQVQYEPGALTAEQQQELTRRGHVLRELDNHYGNMQLVIWNRLNNRVEAASDPRGEGLAVSR
ncbi:gamma-glutamyltransferase [Thiohalophilus thiocyanatoxydans]|uniref:Glutathione hydrolase proenzyme n=1 Tax=Thiohalophilus thiocyanatoxydans TaxID=381308 RepID=A0A4V3H4Q3_9GAMM|nr:gamma-glutamyltransferase [Thiohalophilus thiocyanatoxydans]TDY04115.1 gamma-glutamyltranspeptidase/glutathione hydrolase [Thiohalophilus thiocyanatoxydans]